MPLAPAAAATQNGLISLRSILAKALPSRTTTPRTPPSRTMRLEPRPSAMTGISGSRLAQEFDEIVLVPGLEQPFGMAAALEPYERRKRRIAREPAANLRHPSRRSFARPRSTDPVRDSAAAHLVMSPAPMQMTMSPSAARSRSAAAKIIEVADRAHHAMAMSSKTFDERS